MPSYNAAIKKIPTIEPIKPPTELKFHGLKSTVSENPVWNYIVY